MAVDDVDMADTYAILGSPQIADPGKAYLFIRGVAVWDMDFHPRRLPFRYQIWNELIPKIRGSMVPRDDLALPDSVVPAPVSGF